MRGSQKNINYVIKWTSPFAYSIGLLTADGCLSIDGRHLVLHSKDKEQILNFKKCLNLENKIAKSIRRKETRGFKKCYRIQFSNVKFYKFLQSIGLSPRKSLTIRYVEIPKRFFADFLRGFFDGDGNFNVFKHPESQYPQIRVRFFSASPKFLRWLHREIRQKINTKGGYITKAPRGECLEHAISDSLKILKFMYHSPNIICLSRKFEKVNFILRTWRNWKTCMI